MDGFKEGYEFFETHAGHFEGVASSETYMNTVESEIVALIDALKEFQDYNTPVDKLKGDIAEFWHAGTFNINSAVHDSIHRAQVNRSHEYGSIDISGKNFEGEFGLKYYKDGIESAKQQSKSVFEKYKEYGYRGGKDDLETYLKARGYVDDTVLNNSVYAGQYRVIPSDQLEDAMSWLERKILEEGVKRPEHAHRYQETLDLLIDRISDNKGNASIPLSEEEAKNIAKLAKEDGLDPDILHLTSEEVIQFTDIMKQSCKAGLTAATITLVLKIAPEVWKTIQYLIQTGELDEKHFRKVGFAALSGAGEGFVRGTISAAITTSCKAGLCGASLKGIDPSVVGAVTLLTVDVVKNSYKVYTGDMTESQMANELIKEMFTVTVAMVMGAVAQSFIEIPVFGYMLGSFLGTLAGSFFYSSMYSPVMSLCTNTGFTFFGLVEQDYELPKNVLKEIGIEVFEYEYFEYDKFEYKKFEYESLERDQLLLSSIDITFLRRGVIGVNHIGYIM